MQILIGLENDITYDVIPPQKNVKFLYNINLFKFNYDAYTRYRTQKIKIMYQ